MSANANRPAIAPRPNGDDCRVRGDASAPVFSPRLPTARWLDAGDRPPRMTGAEVAIRRLIAERGRVPFRDFMRLALYHADGYYSRRRRIGGADGDYFTSPTVHPAFGAALAIQIQAMWRALGRPSPFWIIEPGAGDGALARGIAAFARRGSPSFARAMRYAAIDRAPPHAARVAESAASWMRADGIPLSGAVGCVISNELLDAFPVHRFAIQNGEAREIYVGLSQDGGFVETLGDASDAVMERLSRLPFALPDGFRGEVNPEIGAWTASVESCLERGFVLTIDYGGESEEIYAPARARGTFQTHYRHVAGSSPYQRIGRQDMTAHVDFGEVIWQGRRAGLRPIFLTTQAEFLTTLGIGNAESAIRESANPSRAEKTANIRALRRLTQPDGLGGFRVLMQDKASGIMASSDISPQASELGGLTAAFDRAASDKLRYSHPKSGAR